ncbi:flagellar hook-length control protein FliK [Ruegeria sp. HKCCD7255]|uniref:flagellar hook-length control protein FliK n=1 Tax=Ruegeria sp. HKCCD7255 TaxID=2683004 RepID=UPI001487C51E|nr:flagellar hook-length control protein FliK [Ruegeria sp. HKCCD7255]
MPNPLTAMLTTLSAASNSGGPKHQTDDALTHPAFSDVLEKVGLIEERDVAQTITPISPETEEEPSDDLAALEPAATDTDEPQIQIAAIATGPTEPFGEPHEHNDLTGLETESSDKPAVAQTAIALRSENAATPADSPQTRPVDRSEFETTPNKPQNPQIFEFAFGLSNAQTALANNHMARPTAKTTKPVEAPPVELIRRISQPIEPIKPEMPQVQKPVAPTMARSVEMFELRADPMQSSEGEWAASAKETLNTQVARDLSASQMMNTARADTARAIAGQMAAAISAKPGSGAIEIALNPEELGRVSIILNGREDGFQLTIAAERPEALDLMRRHLAVLSSEFQKLGYSDLSFDLGMSNNTGKGGDSTAQDAATSEALQLDEAETTAPPPKTGPDRGLDMRL